jgi:DNA transformation protein and related proteins
VDAESIRDIFSGFGPVGIRRMFGGYGIYADDTMFALVADGELYLKADSETQPGFEAEGSQPFSYEAKGRRVALSYWRAPDHLLDDADEMAVWARKALSAAGRAARTKTRRKSKA